MNRGEATNTQSRAAGRRVPEKGFSQVYFAAGIAAIVLILICSFVFGSFFSSAHDSQDAANYKYYKSVEIEKGDSLWSIAEQYMGGEYESVHDYINELASINNMEEQNLNEIQEGDYLMVAYYDTQNK